MKICASIEDPASFIQNILDGEYSGNNTNSTNLRKYEVSGYRILYNGCPQSSYALAHFSLRFDWTPADDTRQSSRMRTDILNHHHMTNASETTP
jgi:hypothetical protein